MIQHSVWYWYCTSAALIGPTLLAHLYFAGVGLVLHWYRTVTPPPWHCYRTAATLALQWHYMLYCAGISLLLYS